MNRRSSTSAACHVPSSLKVCLAALCRQQSIVRMTKTACLPAATPCQPVCLPAMSAAHGLCIGYTVSVTPNAPNLPAPMPCCRLAQLIIPFQPVQQLELCHPSMQSGHITGCNYKQRDVVATRCCCCCCCLFCLKTLRL